MRAIVNKVVDFIKNAESLVWMVGITAIVILSFALVMSSVIDVVSETRDVARQEQQQRQDVYVQEIEKVKRDCNLIGKVITPENVQYTYSCDGVDFQFEESL